MVTRSRVRFLGIALTLLALALGLWAALWLIGWPIPLLSTSLPDAHGVLMVNGVLASLIGIERAVALEQRVFYLAPLLTAVGAISLALSGDAALAFPIITSGAVALLLIFLVILRRQPALHTVVQVLGAACLVGGNVLGWSGLDIPFLIPWWGTFLVLLLGAERLELSRVLRLTMLDKLTFAISVALTLLGCALSVLFFPSGFLVVASGWILVAVWLLFHDIAYQNLSRPGLPRFTALCLLSGYAWLLLGGGIVYSEGGVLLGFSYDAGLHALFLGFVLSLVFAHALIILPAVLGKRLPFHRVLYVPVALLYISLAVRIYADFGVLPVLREWAGLFNVVAIVLFGALLPALYLYERTPFRRAYGADGSTFYP
ncbi:MAG: hypothetical protein HKL79_06245 [Thermoplasmata archaeon]|nr:hypothetical protein [Thermoplasmata archaeon]